MLTRVQNFFNLIMLLILVLTLSGCNLLKKKTQEQAGQADVPKGKGTESYTFKALKAAIQLGVPLKCSYKVNNVEYEGYVKGKQWRGKIKTAEGKTGEVIMKEKCMYSWEEGNLQGMKMCFDEDIWDTSQEQQAAPEIEYHCAPALIDDGNFVPPANINFMDLSQMGR